MNFILYICIFLRYDMKKDIKLSLVSDKTKKILDKQKKETDNKPISLEERCNYEGLKFYDMITFS